MELLRAELREAFGLFQRRDMQLNATAKTRYPSRWAKWAWIKFTRIDYLQNYILFNIK